MKTTVWTAIICLAAAAFFSGCKQQTPTAPDAGAGATNAAISTNAAGASVLSDENARVSYAIGMSMGRTVQNVQTQGFAIDADLIARGVKDTLSGKATLLTPEQMQGTLTTFQKNLAARQQQKREELAAKIKAEGVAFLATNKDNPGVVTLPDGLQYKVITNGDGAVPAPVDVVTVNYRGTLLDGTEFDSSFKHNQPAQFDVDEAIPGWTEALLRMKVGSRWQLFIPSQLAYGERGRPGVPPNSVLVFDVDLLSTKSPPPVAPPASAAPLTSDIIKVPSAEEMKKGAKIEVIKPEDMKKLQQP